MGADLSLPRTALERLPQASTAGIGTSDLQLLEAFAAATPEGRKELLSKFAAGSPQAFEFTATVSEQLGHPADLEAQLAAVIKATKTDDEVDLPAHMQRYLFRRRMLTLDPSTTRLPTTPEEAKVRSLPACRATAVVLS